MDAITPARVASPIPINGSPRPLSSLHLHPLTGSAAFYPKTIPLPLGNRVVIGRAQATDSEDGTNGLFSCQWMSRNHALIWAGADGKILMRDTRSSNGTWINGTRLSAKGEKSERFGLQSHDILEFGEGQDGVPAIKAEVFDDPTLCVACKSLPVMINSPLVSSLKRQRTLSDGPRNSPKPPLRHRLSVSFSPHVQVPSRNQSGNESDETLMGASRPRSILRDSMIVDEKALPKTPVLERSSSVTSFTSVVRNGAENIDVEFSLLDLAGNNQPSGSDDHELKTAPLVTREALDLGVSEHIKQYGLLGQVAAVYSKSKAERFRDPRIYVNTNAPMSSVVCGVQGSGKSHTVGVLLENMLLPPDPRLGRTQRPLSGLVLHFGEGSATTRTPCEAAHIAVCNDPAVTPPPVRVYVSPASLNTMKTVYAPLGPGVVVEPLYFGEEELDAQAFLSIMAVSGGSDSAPLYMQIVLNILRQLGENYSYTEFIRRLNEEKRNFNPAQSAGLEQRMALLNSFLDPASRASTNTSNTSVKRASFMSVASTNGPSVNGRRAPRFAAGQLTVVDLSDPFIDPASAASLFDIVLRLFIRADVGTGKVCVVDEAHKYLSTEGGKGATSELTQSLLSLIRQQRHLAMRVIISTQEPTVLPPVLIDLCSCLILHRFSSKKWYDHLLGHIAADMPDEAFAQLVSLKTGQAIVISPACIAAFTASTPPTAGSSPKKSVAQLSRRYLIIKTRKRLTNDGGASIMVV